MGNCNNFEKVKTHVEGIHTPFLLMLFAQVGW
jgi:hypothetical protein